MCGADAARASVRRAPPGLVTRDRWGNWEGGYLNAYHSARFPLKGTPSCDVDRRSLPPRRGGVRREARRRPRGSRRPRARERPYHATPDDARRGRLRGRAAPVPLLPRALRGAGARCRHRGDRLVQDDQARRNNALDHAASIARHLVESRTPPAPDTLNTMVHFVAVGGGAGARPY